MDQNKETIVQVRTELDATIDQADNINQVRIAEVQQGTQERLEELQTNTSEKIERVNEEMNRVKNQMNDSTGRIDNIQKVQLKNLREDLDRVSYRPACSVQSTTQDRTSRKRELIKTREEWTG